MFQNAHKTIRSSQNSQDGRKQELETVKVFLTKQMRINNLMYVCICINQKALIRVEVIDQPQ